MGVNLEIVLGVGELKMSLLDEGRDLFELVKSILLVVEHDAVENFSEMAVEVLGDGATNVVCFLQLGADSFQCFLAYAHIYLIF